MKCAFRFDDPVHRADLLAAGFVISLGLVGVLGVTLCVKALERRPVLVLPGKSIETPDRIGDVAALQFARWFIATFDTYTPSTLPAATETLKKRISPRSWSHAAEALDRRIAVAREGRMSSMVVFEGDGTVDRSDGIVIALPARRIVFVADHLSRETRVTYRLHIEATPSNPEGLSVLRQSVEEP